MKSLFAAFLLLAAFCIGAYAYSVEADITGKWDVTIEAPGQQVTGTINFKKEEDKFTGTISTSLGEGTFTDVKATDDGFTATMHISVQGQDMSIPTTGKIDGDNLSGSLDTQFGMLPYSGKRIKE